MGASTKHTSLPTIEQGALTIADAGPGSGKTTTIIDSLARAVNEWSIPPERILAVTFSREMANELRTRCAGRGLTEITTSTLHALCLGLIQEDPQRFGLRPGLEVIGRRETGYLNRQYRRSFRSKPPIRPGLLFQAFNARYEQHITVRAFLSERGVSDAKIDQVIAFLKQYTRTKRQTNKLGFHDMIRLVLNELKADAAYGRRLGRRYKFLAVDEYQDLNAQDRVLVQLLAQHIDTVLIVGDDLQAVHTYRGASTTALQELKSLFPDMCVVSLHQSWRLTKESAAFVNKMLEHNGYDKRITGADQGPVPHVMAANSRNQMYQLAARTIHELIGEGVKPPEIAVLGRFSRSIETFARYLDCAGIAFTLSSNGDRRYKLLLRFRRFLSAAVEEQSSGALRMLLQKEARLDRDTAAQLTDLNKRVSARELGLSQDEHQQVRKIRDAVKLTRDTPRIDRALHIFASAFQGRQDRFFLTPIQHVLRLEGIRFDQNTTLQVLLHTLDQRIKQLDGANGSTPPRSGVTLSTIHAAKGREWQHVLVLDIYDENLSRNGELPVDDAAEFNVFHVAITRAKHQTHLFLLKHEVAVDAVAFRDHEYDIHHIESIRKYQYSSLRFLPRYKHVKHLCSYQRTKTVHLDQDDAPSQAKRAVAAKNGGKQKTEELAARKKLFTGLGGTDLGDAGYQ